jgi:CRP-like cAMP-binding protein
MVDIYRKAEPDKHLKIASIRPGETIGEMGVVDGQPFSASVIATQDSLVLLITRTDFDRLTIQHEKIGIKLLRKIAITISSRLRNTTGRLADLLANR